MFIHISLEHKKRYTYIQQHFYTHFIQHLTFLHFLSTPCCLNHGRPFKYVETVYTKWMKLLKQCQIMLVKYNHCHVPKRQWQVLKDTL
jgi:hypothetical protein